ncbi:MAG TPA: glycosyl hydrolase family 18 protein [Thermoanaerobaculia bacterium]|nr:glycosyl hydrolase family 18 protein [Thermoanaerobaculia bacterium]
MRIRTAAVALLLTLSVTGTSFAWRNTMWIAPWDPASLTSIQANGGTLSESNPVWYEWKNDATIVAGWNSENPTWRAAMTGTLLMPTVQNLVNGTFDANVVATMLSSAATRDAHAEAIAQLVVSKAYDGIDIDYERVPTAQRANFTAFITTLSQKLHAANKKLSVTVYAKASDKENWNGPGSQDWIVLGQLADSIKIMAYDYSWDGSTAGPITPLDWLERVTTYAESTIAPSKVIVGLPFYGYDWVGTAAQTVTYSSAMKLAQTNGATIARDANGEATFSYGGTHTVYFQDAAAFDRKVDVLRQKHPHIGGVAAWVAGQEDPEIWRVLHDAMYVSIAVPGAGASPLPADFSIVGPSSLTIAQGATATAEFRLTAVNGFDANAQVTILAIGHFDGTLAASSSTLSPTSALTLRAGALSTTRPGAYALIVRVTSGSISHDRTVTLTVTPAVARGRVRAVGK